MENKKDSIVICPGAQVIGDVELGENVSIWHGAVLRGDVASIKIGNNSNIQDNCVVHCSKDFPVVVKENVSVGHGAVIHGCTLEDNSSIGFRDSTIDELMGGRDEVSDYMEETDRDACLKLFEEYSYLDKEMY